MASCYNLTKDNKTILDIITQFKASIDVFEQKHFQASYWFIEIKDLIANIKMSDFNQRVKSNWNTIVSMMKYVKLIISEHDHYLRKHPKICLGEEIVAYHLNRPIGIVALFTPTQQLYRGHHFAVMQSITASPILLMAKVLYPETKLPKINQLLIPKVITMAKDNKCKFIVTDPMDKQSKILKGYGFIDGDDDICIFGDFSVTAKYVFNKLT